MSETVVIDERFRGPPHSANGGYACALVAAGVEDGPVEVTLRAPPPLGEELTVRRDERGAELVGDDGTLLAVAVPVEVPALEVPDPIGIEAAERAAALYPWRDSHPYPGCFVCGPEREADGLRIFPGPVGDERMFAAPWIPGEDLADAGGLVRDEFVWGALDCPSGIVTDLFGEVGRMLLGRLTADLRGPVIAGEPHVIQAWPLSRDGRKLNTASAIFGPRGDLLAVARAVWIEVAEAGADG